MMKTKKFDFKKYIFPVITSVVVFALMVFLIVVTRKPESAEAASSVTIGGKTYSADGTHMVVLEVVPDESYDVLGSLVADDQGVVKWTDIVKDQPKVGTVNFDAYGNPATDADKTKNDQFTQYIKDYAHKYISSINSTLGGKVAKAYFRVKDTDKLYSVLDADVTIARQID